MNSNHVQRVVALLLGSSAVAHAGPGANALPTGGQIVRGDASVQTQGNRLNVTQRSDKAVLNWQSFDVGRDATVSFSQPSRSSVALNRVMSADPSEIFGQLLSNGHVFLSNPNGVLIGSGAKVNVGGLVATSMTITPDDFMAGRYRFTNGAGAVVNQGTVEAAEGGVIALLAPEVRNEGILSAKLGTVALAAGEAVTLQIDGEHGVAVQVDPAKVDVLLENRSLIDASGGHVILAASAAERLLDTAIPGTTGATNLVIENGTARLVDVSGTVRANDIDVDGGHVGVTQIAGTLDASSTTRGGDITIRGDKIQVDPSAALKADAQQSGDGGRIVVKADDGARVSGNLSARGGANGGDGGFIETSGAWVDLQTVPDASAPQGHAGEWLIDPYDITIQAAGSNTNIGSSPDWQSTGNSAILLTSSINTALNAGTSVSITTGAGGSQGGDIKINSAISKTAGGSASLSFSAHRDIQVNAPISSTTGALSLTFNADSNDDLAGSIVLANNLTTKGGAIDFQDGTVIAGGSAIAIDTSGGAGGNVDFRGQVIIGNANGVTITTGGGNVTFQSLLDSGNTYSLINSLATWNAARSAASSGTGANTGDTYLATITSPLEMSQSAAAANYQASWIGGSDAAAEGTWRWVVGPEGLENGGQGRIFTIGNRPGSTPVQTGFVGYNGAYVNWNAGEPNDSGGEDALELGFGPAGQWNDFPINSATLPYVRETVLAPSPLTISAAAGAVTFSGNIGANKALGSLTINNDANVYLNANTVNIIGNIDLRGPAPVVLGAASSPTLYADDGSIFLYRNIVKNAGADASLVLRADGDITVQGAAISSTSNRLNVTLNSDRDASGSGAIDMSLGSLISSKGGDIVLRGGFAALGAVPDPTSDAPGFLSTVNATGAHGTGTSGVTLDATRIDAAGGNIDLRGVGGSGFRGIDLSNGSAVLTTDAGKVALHGMGGATGNEASGVRITESGTGVSTEDGELRIQGLGRGGNSSRGVEIFTPGFFAHTTVSTSNGNLVMRGASQGTGASNQGVLLDQQGSAETTSLGNVDVIGRAGGGGGNGTGVHLLGNSAIRTTGGGDLTLTGYGSTSGSGSNNEGVKVDDSIVDVQTGPNADLTFNGTGGTGAFYNIGVNVRVNGIVRMGANAGGVMTINGQGGSSTVGSWGVLAEADATYESLGAAPIRITGIGGHGSDNAGIRVTAGNNRIGSSGGTGDITLTADTMDLVGSGNLIVDSLGELFVQPLTPDASIGVGDFAPGAFKIDSATLSRFGTQLSRVTLGRTDGFGQITADSTALNNNLRLLNTGPNSPGILITGSGLDIGQRDLWLASSGLVTQTAGIHANRLLLTGDGEFSLTDASNVVNTMAGVTGGAVSYLNADNLTVGAISADGTTYSGLTSGGAVSLSTAGTAGDITLDNAVHGVGSGTSVELRSGRNFFNAAGANALDASGGRWLVWSTEPALDTRGAIPYDFKQYGATFGVAQPAQAAGNGVLYSFQPSITPRLTGSISKGYDGTADTSLLAENLEPLGAIDGDSISFSAPTSSTFDTRNAGTGKTITATGIALAGASNAGVTVYGYQLATTSASRAIGAITAKALTPGLSGTVSKVYDGTNVATLSETTYTLTGVLGSDVVFLDGPPTTGAYDTADAGTGKTVSVGSGLVLAGPAAGNYLLAASSVSAPIGTISPKGLTVAANSVARVYGDANPDFTATYDGFVAGQDAGVLSGALSFETPATVQSNVGDYAVTPGGLTSSNYSIGYVPGTLTVRPAPLTVSADDKLRPIRTDNPALTASYSGFKLGDDASVVSGLALNTSADRNSGPGNYAITATGAQAGNYLITQENGTLTVAAPSGVGSVPSVDLVGTTLPTSSAAPTSPSPIISVVNTTTPMAHVQTVGASGAGAAMFGPPAEVAIQNGGVAPASGSGAAGAATGGSPVTLMTGGFAAVEPITIITVPTDGPLDFVVPGATFRHSNPNVAFSIAAFSADGSALPDGISFDPQRHALTAPAGTIHGDFWVLLVARDGLGGEARTLVKLHGD